MRARAIGPLQQLDEAVRPTMFSRLLGKHTSVLRIFSGAIAIQAMLSASAFIVGLLLVRRTSDAEYGYYVLIITTVGLVTSLQSSFIGPPMIIRMARADRPERANLIGGLDRDQTRILPYLALAPLIMGAVLKIQGSLDFPIAM